MKRFSSHPPESKRVCFSQPWCWVGDSHGASWTLNSSINLSMLAERKRVGDAKESGGVMQPSAPYLKAALCSASLKTPGSGLTVKKAMLICATGAASRASAQSEQRGGRRGECEEGEARWAD